MSNAEQIKESEETGKYWNCPHCWWEGPGAAFNIDEKVMRCPECDDVIDDRLQQQMKDDGVYHD